MRWAQVFLCCLSEVACVAQSSAPHRYKAIDDTFDKPERWTKLETFVAGLHHPKKGPCPAWSFSFYAPTYGILVEPSLITLQEFPDGTVVMEARTGPHGEPFIDTLEAWMNGHPGSSAQEALKRMPTKTFRSPSTKFPHLKVEAQRLRAIWNTYRTLKPGDRMMTDGYWPIVFGDAPDGSFTIGPTQETPKDPIPHWCAEFMDLYPEKEPVITSR